jgi:capsular polysaccharide biosynthesis protein
VPSDYHVGDDSPTLARDGGSVDICRAPQARYRRYGRQPRVPISRRSMSSQPFASRSSTPREEGIDGRRYLAALRRSGLLMTVIVVVLTVAVLLASLVMAKSYRADAQIIVPQTVSLTTSDATSAQRYLATLRTLVTSPKVLEAVAAKTGRTRAALEKNVAAAVDPNANLIAITADDGTAEGAARIANATAAAFLASQTALQRTSLERAKNELSNQIRALRASPFADNQSVQAQISALNDRLAELSVSLTNAGSDLQIARAAEVPDAPTSPKPLRNAILALFAAIFVAVLAALARDQLRPGVTDQREVSEILDLPLLATIPEKPGRRSLRRAALAARIEQEAYRTLAASLRLTLKTDRDHVLLTTSALHAEGKTSVTLRLGRLLAESGRRTLIVSADLRWPRLDGLVGLEGRPGLSDLLQAADAGVEPATVREHIAGRGPRDADVLPAGTLLGDDAAPLLTSERLDAVFLALSELGYVYVLVDAPPLLGLGDTQVLASMCDELLVVARVRGLHIDNLIDLRATLDRLPIRPLGAVVIGGHGQASPYYAVRSGQSTVAPDGERTLPELTRR